MVTGGRRDRDPIVRWFSDASLSRRQATLLRRPPRRAAAFSCGRPTEAHRIAIVDPDSHSTMPEGGVGEIWFQGPSVCEGYWARPEASRDAFEASRDGHCGPWMRTGDLGFVLEGELYPLGRLADLIQHERGWLYPHLPELDLERSGVMRGPVVLVTDPSAKAGGQPIIAMGELRKTALEEEGPRHAAAVHQVLASAGVHVDEVIFVPPRTVGRTSSGKRDSGGRPCSPRSPNSTPSLAAARLVRGRLYAARIGPHRAGPGALTDLARHRDRHKAPVAPTRGSSDSPASSIDTPAPRGRARNTRWACSGRS